MPYPKAPLWLHLDPEPRWVWGMYTLFYTWNVLCSGTETIYLSCVIIILAMERWVLVWYIVLKLWRIKTFLGKVHRLRCRMQREHQRDNGASSPAQRQAVASCISACSLQVWWTVCFLGTSGVSCPASVMLATWCIWLWSSSTTSFGKHLLTALTRGSIFSLDTVCWPSLLGWPWRCSPWELKQFLVGHECSG